MNPVEEPATITRNSVSPTSVALNHHKTRTPERDGVRGTHSLTPTATGNGLPVGAAVQNNGNSNSRSYPYNLEVKLEAVDRIQTQVNLNRASMEGFSRELQRANAEIHTIKLTHNSFADQTEHYSQIINELRTELIALKQEMATLRTNPVKSSAPATSTAPTGERMDDQTLEIISSNLALVSTKANEVDNLRLGQELLKRRVLKLEEQTLPTNVQAKGENPVHQAVPHNQITAQPPQASPPTMTHPNQRERRLSSVQYAHMPQHAAVEASTTRHPTESDVHGSWPTVNKRPLVNGVDVPHSSGDSSPSKRQRLLAPLEPRQRGESTRYDPARQDTGGETTTFHRTDSNESYPDSTESAVYHAPGYPDREAAAHDVERQRTVSASAYGTTSGASPVQHHSPISRGRGRGGRPRKYMPADRSAWQSEKAAIVNGQVVQQGADGQWYAMGPADSSRRSSVADPAITMSPASQAAALRQSQTGGYSPGMHPSPAPRDPYAHTKKTRTKPIRNADGVLIRKDGRPDMRSHSSAANLRKVHAKKEQERRMEAAAHQGQNSYSHGDETRATSTSSTPAPHHSPHHSNETDHDDEHEDHDDEDHDMKDDREDDHRRYSNDLEKQRYTPSVEAESVTTPESLRDQDMRRSRHRRETEVSHEDNHVEEPRKTRSEVDVRDRDPEE